MRISRSRAPDSSPSLPPLPPMEIGSWALEVEREACLHGEDESLHSDTGMGLKDKGRNELTSDGASKTSDFKPDKKGMDAFSRYDDSATEMHWTQSRPQAHSFSASSRCYAPKVHAPSACRFPRGSIAANRVANTGRSTQERSTKTKRAAAVEALHHRDCNSGEPKEDDSVFGRDGLSARGRLFRNCIPAEDRAKCSYADKISWKGHFKNEVGSPKQWRSAIRRRYNDTAAYKSVDRTPSEEDRNTFSRQKTLEPRCRKGLQLGRVEQGDAKEQNEMLDSLLLDESKRSEVHLDSREAESERKKADFMEFPVSMEVDNDAKSNKIASPTGGRVSRSKGPELKDNDTSLHQNARRSCDSLPPLSSRPVLVDVTNMFELHAAPGVKEEVQETDAHRLNQRQRQIDYGKNTLGYERYTELVPRLKRKARDPQTPNSKQVCSKRSWDGQIRKWRRLLHQYDPPSEDGEEIAEDLSAHLLRRGCLQNTNPDAADASTLSKRHVELDGDEVDDAVERIRREKDASWLMKSDQRVAEDANLTIYDDWMES